jgi:hypothetical protein
LSLRAYAEQVGCGVRRLYWWRMRLADAARACPAPAFLPVQVRSEPEAWASSADVLEVVLPHVQLRIGARVPLEATLRVLAFFGPRSC